MKNGYRNALERPRKPELVKDGSRPNDGKICDSNSENLRQ